MRISRSTGAVSGLLIVLVAIWGGIIPFVGPYFNYSFGSNATWSYSANRLWLDIAPAVVAIAGGLAMIRSGHRVSGIFGSWLALAAGAWFALGPAVSRIWEHGLGPIGVPLYGPTRQAVELIGYFYGVGALIIAAAAFALGRFVTRAAIADESPTSTTAVENRSADTTNAGGEIRTREPVAAGVREDSMAASGTTPGDPPEADDVSARPGTPQSPDSTDSAAGREAGEPVAGRR